MRLTLVTTYSQTIEVDDEIGEQMIADWQEGDESLVEPMFDDADRYGYQSRLHQEPSR